jgi:2-keto-4-pentenoate hydratase/2-oxohepta-3-ene-1,7-dioic acid hydratase in catechol pathway
VAGKFMKIICVGRNYAEHAKEMNSDIPTEPVIFMKPKGAVLLPEKPLYYPEFTDDLQYECEVVVKICKNGKHIQEKFANKYYDQVTLGIDFTARDLQNALKKKGLPWEISKGFDGSAAVGTFVPITAETNVRNLAFQLKMNGETVQDGHTRNMIFTIDNIIAYVSKFFTINIGDLIFTGTPAGVGPVAPDDVLEGYLQGNKVLEVEIK